MLSSRRSLRTWLSLGIIALCFAVVIADRSGRVQIVAPYAASLYGWAVVLGAVALVLGAVNILWVHIMRIRDGQQGWWQSLVLVVALVAVVVAGIINPAGDRSPLIEWTFDAVLAPGYAALFALLAFFTAAAIYQQVRLRSSSGRWIMLGLLGMALMQMPAARLLLPAEFPTIANWIVDVPVTATLRGALLGVGLALIIVAFRYLLGRRT